MINITVLFILLIFFQLRAQGYACRPAENECDLTELCTGTSGECPADLWVKNLVPCNQEQGYCFNGQCPTIRNQCKEVWGHKAGPGDEACYQKFNMGGTQSGNCGNRPYGGGFKPCDIENILCGTLHCQEGSSKPRIPGRNSFVFLCTLKGALQLCSFENQQDLFLCS